MIRKNADALIGKTLTHKKYGAITVQEFTSYKEDKFIGIINETNETKKFVLSCQFFVNTTNIKLPKHEELKPIQKNKVKKPHNYEKYRNHPLVKEIDRRESNRYNRIYATDIDYDE